MRYLVTKEQLRRLWIEGRESARRSVGFSTPDYIEECRYREEEQGIGLNVYLSGPVTGKKDNNRALFDAARAELERKGCEVYSPIDVVRPDAGHEEAMLTCLHDLTAKRSGSPVPFFDYLALLPGWEDSDGCVAEGMAARACGIKTVPFGTLLAALALSDEGAAR